MKKPTAAKKTASKTVTTTALSAIKGGWGVMKTTTTTFGTYGLSSGRDDDDGNPSRTK